MKVSQLGQLERTQKRLLLLVPVALLMLTWLLAACQEQASVAQATETLDSGSPVAIPSVTPIPEATLTIASQQAPPLPTPLPTSTPLPTPTATPTPPPTPTATPVGACTERMPTDGLLTLVTAQYGLSREYVPPGLVRLSSYLPVTITLGYPTEIRAIVVAPLLEMMSDMQATGLKPTIISGYRSYQAQLVASNKWQEKYPDRATIISAAPGHSEHQLGTTIDFGSPELADLVGDEDIEFHTNFYLTSEGEWLAEHAHEYGFVLSYPRDTFELTGMYYEPWHFRYVGREFATMLKDQGSSLINYLLSTQLPPCIP